MRDLFFFGFFIVMLIISFRKPFVAVAIWLWSGIFVPANWLYGFALSIRFNYIFAISAILSYLFFYKKKTFEFDFLYFLVIVFFLHTTLTTMNTLIDPTVAWFAWEGFMKVIAIFIFIPLIIKTKVHFKFMVWITALSIGFYGFVEGLKFIKSGGAHHIHGPAFHLLGDNNHLALALLMVVPLVVFLFKESKEKWIKIGLIVLAAVCILAVLGTKSRGGFIGLVAVGGYFWIKSNRKILALLAIGFLSLISSHLLTDSWFDRMNTMHDVEGESSYVARVTSWKIHTLMAIERPVLGGGFMAPQFGRIWRSLAQNYHLLDFIPTPPPGKNAWAAHSIYFQVLGDHGFVGLFLFLGIIALAFFKLSLIESHFKGEWQAHFANMIKVSLLAFCVTGAALSMAYFELFYVLIALIVSLSIMRKQDLKAKNAASYKPLACLLYTNI